MNNKIVKTKKFCAIFLAIVLVAGTITAISPLFITGVNAQGDPYYDGMDSYDDRKSYGMDDSYGASDYGMDKKKYDSYGASDYGMDNDRKSYDNIYKSQYQSYKPDYKPVKDDKRDKSNKDSKVDINKLKCINTNLNINGENAGNVSIGNKGGVADGGYVGDGYSSVDDDSDGYGSDDGYYNDGYNKNKKDNGFDCIINNNNTNINTVSGGNVTEPKPTCGECFSRLTQPLQNSFNMFLNDEVQDIVLSPTLTIPGSVIGISDLCTFFNTVDPIPLTQAQITAFINMLLQELPGVSTIPNAQAQLQALVLCLIEADIIVVV